MPTLLHLVSKAPLPKRIQLPLQRVLLERAFDAEIENAIKSKDNNKAESLRHEYQFEIDIHSEDEDAYETRRLISKARRMRLSVPNRYDEDGSISQFWYEGRYTGGWYLTSDGISLLRASVRKEAKESHEVFAIWTKWLIPTVAAVVGIIAAVIKIIK